MVLLFGIINLKGQTCLPDGVIFTSQEQVDSFAIAYPGCTEILGDLIVSGFETVTSLDGLSQITSVGGDFEVKDNFFLTSLSGLSNINSIAGDIVISSNFSLLDLSGLEFLTVASNDLDISNNDVLQNLLGLSNLTSVVGDFIVSNNDDVQNLAGLESLLSVGDEFRIENNNVLENLSGLESLTAVTGEFAFTGNDALVDFNGLESLSTLTYNLFVSGNSALQNFSGLEGLTSIVAGGLYISNNNALESLEGLNNLAFIGTDLRIVNNLLLDDIDDLELVSLNISGGTLALFSNPNLSVCHTPPFVCDFISGGGFNIINDNAVGCNSESEILAACFAEMPHDNLIGNVIADYDQNCLESTGDESLENWFVHAYNDDYSLTLSSDSSGDYWIPLLEGSWNIEVISPSSLYC